MNNIGSKTVEEGRKMINAAAKYIKENNLDILYGDTDGDFILKDKNNQLLRLLPSKVTNKKSEE